MRYLIPHLIIVMILSLNSNLLKLFCIILTLSTLSFSQVMERKSVPQDVMEEAQSAVQSLANEVMKGNFLYSLDHIYPRWTEAAERQTGGKDALRKRLEALPREMQEKGISIIDFKAERPVSAFEVKAEHNRDAKKAPVFSEYLVFVPTRTLYLAIDPNGGVVVKIESKGFQAAIVSQAPPRKWSFIDGSSLTVQELRALFPLLPHKEEALLIPERSQKKL